MMAADSTVRNTLARLMASFQINVLAASRLQCSVARIWAACDPSGWSLATPVARAAAASGASGVPDSDRVLWVSWSVVPIADILKAAASGRRRTQATLPTTIGPCTEWHPGGPVDVVGVPMKMAGRDGDGVWSSVAQEVGVACGKSAERRAAAGRWEERRDRGGRGTGAWSTTPRTKHSIACSIFSQHAASVHGLFETVPADVV